MAEIPLAGIEPTSTALAMAIARFYWRDDKEEDGKFKEANLGGILCFIIDRKLKSRFFRLYDINTSELLFQTELFVNFANNFTYICDKFYCFPLVKAVLGVEFANLNDALYFKRLIDKAAIANVLTMGVWGWYSVRLILLTSATNFIAFL